MTADELVARAAELRSTHLDEQRELVGRATDDYFLYDAVLETAMMFGLVPADAPPDAPSDAPPGVAADVPADVPAGFASTSDHPFERLTALARGTPEREAWEMTKWFDTNYHYVVPIIDRAPTTFSPLPWREPTTDADTTWAVVGPYSLVKLAHLAGDADATEIVRAAGQAFWSWARQQADHDPGFELQLDEPCLGLVMDADDEALLDAAYANAGGIQEPPIVSVQFGEPSSRTLLTLGQRGLAVQVPIAAAEHLAENRGWDEQPEHVIGVMDGRSVWPDDFAPVRDALSRLPQDGKPLRLVPSTSLMFLPHTVEGEDLPEGFQFAREKARALADWARALTDGSAPTHPSVRKADWPEVGELAQRAPRPDRRDAQRDLDLPPYPTTSTGSLPQTAEVRHLRVQLHRGELDADAYRNEVDRLITDAIRWQEEKGIDVLVHGEFERTDMVEYFAERLDGYLTTTNGWVLSYGSRCTRPPILAAPPSTDEPMTVREWRVAQSASSRPVKGMLTGPVTIVNWSFRPPGVPDDQLFWAVALPIAEEVRRLVEAGARVVQVDEPAVRERWPLPTVHADELRAIYARGVRAALNHVFNQPAHVQMHTHMCYGDFGDIVPLWSDAGVDVASIEFSRSKDDSYIRQFYGLFADGHLQIGPGVFDVHSPHSPGAGTMDDRLEHFLSFMDATDLWVNPDCGLKTRGWDEIERQLSDMVAAARSRRQGAA
jgi:5-methyltetrahydropteroyltriglutamate--homocysteine methyltransferase